MKKILALVLGFVMIITYCPVYVFAVDAPSIYGKIITSSTTYTAQADENIKVSGEGVVAEITLSGVTINKSGEVSVSAIRVENGATVKLTVLGTNTLRGAEGCAGISVDETSTLIITDTSTGTLNAYGGLMAAGIGGDAECNNGTIIINGGNIRAIGGENAGAFADSRGGAGIGGGNNGDGGSITINGGTISATGGDYSAGIGAGHQGKTGTIVINNGTINSNSGYEGAGIGGIGGSITINGGTIIASDWAYAAGIGGSVSGRCDTITINGGKITASGDATAIGRASSIVINGGEIIAKGDGMTGGSEGIGEVSSIKITGGNIEATGNANATAIDSANIIIEGGVIIANGGSEAAGIGGTSGTVTISGGTITAKGGYNAAGIGGESGVGGCTIVITGGSIKATPGSENADAIGSGANGTASYVTNGVENGNKPLSLVTVENAVKSDNTKLANVVVDAGEATNAYEYLYTGYGHSNDSKLYFYLPENHTVHVWDEGEVTKQPTCTETGNKTYTCSCGEVEIEIIPARGHHVSVPGKEMVDSYTLVNDSKAPFSFVDGWYSSTNKSHGTTSVFEIRATYDCTLVLQYKVSSESGYDKLIIMRNGTTIDTVSGEISEKVQTFELVAGDVLHIKYSKDSSASNGADTGYFSIYSCTQTEIDTTIYVSADEIEPTCSKDVVCSSCQQIVKRKLKHNMVFVDEKKATCTEFGWDAYEYCTVCDYTTYAEKKALDHDIIIDEAVAPKCGETGLTAGQHCSRCDDMTVIQEVVPALTHKDDDGDYKCDNGCGHELEKPVEPEQPDTPDEPTGETCTDCGKVHTNFFSEIICFFIRIFNFIKNLFA